jgi:hypothetical protein
MSALFEGTVSIERYEIWSATAMTTKQETLDLLWKLYDAKEITLSGYYVMRSAVSQMEIKP